MTPIQCEAETVTKREFPLNAFSEGNLSFFKVEVPFGGRVPLVLVWYMDVQSGEEKGARLDIEKSSFLDHFLPEATEKNIALVIADHIRKNMTFLKANSTTPETVAFQKVIIPVSNSSRGFFGGNYFKAH